MFMHTINVGKLVSFTIIGYNGAKEDFMKLYYGFDTMCMFCYGFGPIMKEAYNKYSEDLEFIVLPAAMWSAPMWANPIWN